MASVSPQICEKQAQTPTGGKARWPPFHLRYAKNMLWPRQEEKPAGLRFTSDLQKTSSGPDKRKCLLAAVSPQICEKHALAPTRGNACWPPFHLRFVKNMLWPRQEEMPAGRISPQICEKHALTPTRGNASRPRFTSDMRLTYSGPDKTGHFREERKLPGRAETPGKR